MTVRQGFNLPALIGRLKTCPTWRLDTLGNAPLG